MIEEILEKFEFELVEECEEGFLYKNEMIYMSVVYPHSSNDFKYLVRLNHKNSFDKWSNCESESLFNSLDQEKDKIIEFIDDFIYNES